MSARERWTCGLSAGPQGLPPQWSSLLQVSGISKTELAKNPQGMLDVLGYYTEGQSGGVRCSPRLAACGGLMTLPLAGGRGRAG